MSKSKDKGRRIENLIAEMHRNAGVPSKRMPLSGSMGGEYAGDVQVMNGRFLGQVKGRAKCQWKVFLKWLEGHEILFVKEDRQAPYVFMPWNVYIDLMKAYNEAENGTSCLTDVSNAGV